MKYFDKYASNTLGAAGNQHFFINEDPERSTVGRVFYKIFAGGRYNYSFLFSNIIDSTYADGAVSHKNLLCDEWVLESAAVALADECDVNEMPELGELIPLTFGGSPSKSVAPGELFSSDGVELDAQKGQFLCLEIKFKGRMIPYHYESLLPLFRLEDGEWRRCKQMPVAGMVGCDRKVKRKIGFIGDSITQGIGTPENSYRHYAAVVADILGEDYSYWDIGLGYGRGDDAASDGAWLFKAKQLDVITVCYGVNDLYRGFSETQLIDSLERIVTKLHEAGVKVILQSIPPYDYPEALEKKWRTVNEHIYTSLGKRTEAMFDVVPILGKSEAEPHLAKYGGHPNSEGNRIWGRALAETVRAVAEAE